MADEKIKAYVVTEAEEGAAAVVFASLNAEARRKGAAKLGSEWESVECRRSRKYDVYAPGPVSPLVLIEHGWVFECSACNRPIDSDAIAEERRSPVVAGELIYCSPWCRLSAIEESGRHRAQEKMGARMAEAALPSFCTVTRGAVFTSYDPVRRRSRNVPGAYFTFPGARYGSSGTWSADLRDMAMVAKGDYDTYQELKAEWMAMHAQRGEV